MAPALGRCGPFELLRWVEAGGMGEIFVARGPKPSGGTGLAAVKRLLPQAAQDPTFVKMFHDEGRLAKRLNHPNVCRTWDLGQTDDGQYYLAMEWIDGVSLQLLVRRARGREPIPVPFATRIIADVCAALDYAHRLEDDDGRHLGIVHRDVSPPNVMLDLRGRVKLLDFGLAKARTQLVKTQPGYVKGKFGYLAPEQLTGKVDYRTDVFALGLCLFELLTGTQVFAQQTAAETVTAIQGYTGPPDVKALRPETTDELLEIIHKSLAPRPADRFSSAGEMKLYLERALRKMEAESVGTEELRVYVRDLFPERHPAEPSLPPPPVPDAQSIAEAAAEEVDFAELAPARKPHLLIAVGALAAVAALAVVIWLLSG